MEAILLGAIKLEYQLRLARHGIPADPTVRTADQQQTAAAIFWAVMVTVTSLAIITQDSVEVK